MAHTKNASYASQINSIYEKIAANKELNELSKRLVKENVEIKYQKFADKENVKLKVLELAFADLQEEINKRLASEMLSYNIKDYWKRREAIQTMRKAGGVNDENAFKAYQEKVNELNSLKLAKENEIKEKIKEKLLKYIELDETKRQEKITEYNKVKEQVNKTLSDYRFKLENEAKIKCEKLDKSNKAKEDSLIKKANTLKEKNAHLDNQIETLDDSILLKVDHLTMQFGGLKAVDDLSFEVKKGEVFGLIGPNGAGKTTVFNCITQFYTPTKGNIYFNDRGGSTILLNDIKVHDVVKKGIVRTFQNVEVVKEVSVLDNLLIAAHSQYHSNLVDQFLHLPVLKKEELAIKEKALEVLDFLGLSMYKDMLAWGLPYGVLKKIEIARTLMNNPQLIILDEPAAGLNDSETAELTKLIRMIQEKYKCTILLVEHDMGLVMDICDTVCAISFGKMLAIGTTKEIQANKDVQSAYLGTDEE